MKRNLLELLPAVLCAAVSAGRAQVPAAVPVTDRFEFKEPAARAYRVEAIRDRAQTEAGRHEWLRAWPDDGSTNSFEFGNRIVLQLRPGTDLELLLSGHPLRRARAFAPNVFVLQAPDARTAVREADNLARLPGVAASYPVARGQLQLHGTYAPKPNDPYFQNEWHLENRDINGLPGGADLNVRAAWPVTRGEGTVIAIGDEGVELTHPDLVSRASGAPHYDFAVLTADGSPKKDSASHGTAVAGLAAATGENQLGIVGVAPAAQLASWVIFDTNGTAVSGERLADMFQYASNIVSVQNHSWGSLPAGRLGGPGLLEQIAISNAITYGRGGKGVVMVRTAGNFRPGGDNANYDAYTSDPRAVAVASVRLDGRVASYSNPGACVLVAAPGGDTGFPNLFTTDRQGSRGFNSVIFNNDLADYAYGSLLPFGTSFSAPQIAGLVALVLSANTNLGYRDVQQILIHSARHLDLADPDLATNGAGFRVSHNVGFGVPDAGQAVALARRWINRPALVSVTVTATNATAIPDDGLRVLISGLNVPTNLASLAASPSLGLHPDDPTATLPLVFAGLATLPISQNLTGKVALIQRGVIPFSDKIQNAAQAGATAAILFNTTTNPPRLIMGNTDFAPIPAVFIGQTDGESLRDLLGTNSSAQAQFRLIATSYSLAVTNALSCEHVGVTLQTDYTNRADLRLTVMSPQGTRSVLQRVNNDQSPGPGDWTYYSTHHFHESSVGAWRVEVSDESAGNTGTVLFAALTIHGISIADSDGDGLDDAWERNRLGTLAYGSKDDPDGDGYSNAREQIMGTDPLANDRALVNDLSRWNERLLRLSWPGRTDRSYQVFAGTDLGAPLAVLTNLPGRFPEMEWFTPYTNLPHHFFQVREAAP